MITGLAHVCFVVRDLEAAEVFYRDKLGFKTAFDFVSEERGRFGTYLHIRGRSFLELFVGAVGRPAKQPSYQHLCLEVDDLQATVAELRAQGLEVSEPTLGSDHSWQAWLSDPEGNRIELHQYTLKSKQQVALGPEAQSRGK